MHCPCSPRRSRKEKEARSYDLLFKPAGSAAAAGAGSGGGGGGGKGGGRGGKGGAKKGGKGVATGAGIFFALIPVPAAAAFVMGTHRYSTRGCCSCCC